METLFGDLSVVQIVQAFVAIVAFPILLIQLGVLRNNLRLLRQNLLGATHDRVYAHYNEICSIFVADPQIRTFFYEGREVDPEDRAVARKVDAVSEAVLGLIEHAVVQRANMPPGSWDFCWRPYAKERIGKSIALRTFFETNMDWYTGEMREQYEAIMKDVRAEAPTPNAIAPGGRAPA